MKSRSVRFLTQTGLIAALYTALTMVLAPFAFGPVQCRVGESLTVLAAFTPAAVPGLTVGCMLSNLLGLATGANVAGALDVLLGPLATGLAAWLSYRLRRVTWGGLPMLSTLPPVLLNAVIIGAELTLVSPTPTGGMFLTQMGLVGAGQLIACVGGGLLLAKTIKKIADNR
ncbi:MAG: QueT transporter family protein [Ruminococcaceae bacterium]|nr:QueT transporter family protein [Oscillospiraceae bacterium]